MSLGVALIPPADAGRLVEVVEVSPCPVAVGVAGPRRGDIVFGPPRPAVFTARLRLGRPASRPRLVGTTAPAGFAAFAGGLPIEVLRRFISEVNRLAILAIKGLGFGLGARHRPIVLASPTAAAPPAAPPPSPTVALATSLVAGFAATLPATRGPILVVRTPGRPFVCRGFHGPAGWQFVVVPATAG
ncbi:MAG: hypothetical protein RLZZ440_2294 [Planctomycetota bacterium]